MRLDDFNATEVEPLGEFKPIPEGKYLAAIVDSVEKQTKAGTGSYLELKLEVLDGEFKGRNLWSRLNLNNPNQQAVDIARAELSAICHAVGVMTPDDSLELHDIPMTITVKCKNRADNGQITNEVKGYQAREKAERPAESANGSAPWQKAS